jgi:hypothetical protein
MTPPRRRPFDSGRLARQSPGALGVGKRQAAAGLNKENIVWTLSEPSGRS